MLRVKLIDLYQRYIGWRQRKLDIPDRVELGAHISATKRAYKKKLAEREKIKADVTTGKRVLVDRDEVLKLVRSDGMLLEIVPEEYRNDKEVVEAAVGEGMALERECDIYQLPASDPAGPLAFVSEALQNDKDIVRDVIYLKDSYEAFFYESSEQRSNHDVVFEALEQECSAPELDDKVLEHLGPSLLQDHDRLYEFLKEYERLGYDNYRIGDPETALALGIDDGPSLDLTPDNSVPYLDVLAHEIKEMLKDDTIREKALIETTWANRYVEGIDG